MKDRARPDLIAALRARLARRGVDVDNIPDYPIESARQDMIPFVGNVHIPAGRVSKRDDVNRRFKALNF